MKIRNKKAKAWESYIAKDNETVKKKTLLATTYVIMECCCGVSVPLPFIDANFVQLTSLFIS